MEKFGRICTTKHAHSMNPREFARMGSLSGNSFNILGRKTIAVLVEKVDHYLSLLGFRVKPNTNTFLPSITHHYRTTLYNVPSPLLPHD